MFEFPALQCLGRAATVVQESTMTSGSQLICLLLRVPSGVRFLAAEPPSIDELLLCPVTESIKRDWRD